MARITSPTLALVVSMGNIRRHPEPALSRSAGLTAARSVMTGMMFSKQGQRLGRRAGAVDLVDAAGLVKPDGSPSASRRGARVRIQEDARLSPACRPASPHVGTMAHRADL